MDRRKNDIINPAEFDLIGAIMVLWRNKNVIIFGTFIITVISIITVLFLPRTYYSSGFLNTYWPYRDIKEKSVKLKKETVGEIGYKINLVESKNIIALVNDDDKVSGFINSNKKKLNVKGHDEYLLRIVENKLIEPVYAYKRLKKKQDNKNNFIVGFNIKSFGRTPKKAQRNVVILKKYISCVIINKELYEYASINLNWENNKVLNYKNQILKLKFKLNEMTYKEKELSKIVKQFSILNKNNNVILSNKNEKDIFMSPLQVQAQLKIGIIETLQKIKKTNWLNKISDNKILLLEKFSELLKKDGNVSVDLDLIEKLKKIFIKYIDSYKTKSKSVDIAINDVKEKLSYFEQLKDHVFRFTAEPFIPKSAYSPRRTLIVVTTAILSFLLLSLLIILLDNWKKRKN